MQPYFTSLIKKKYSLLYFTDARPYLGISQQRIAGKVLAILFDKRMTTFEISDFVKTSKKLRSNTVEVHEREIFQYNFVGICIAHKKDPYWYNTSFLIRNTFDRTPYELNVNLYSPTLEDIFGFSEIQKLIYITHNKYYYLRKKPMPQSTIYFDYVIDMFDHDIIQKEDQMIKNMIQ